jgi:hypothetical protein
MSLADRRRLQAHKAEDEEVNSA